MWEQEFGKALGRQLSLGICNGNMVKHLAGLQLFQSYTGLHMQDSLTGLAVDAGYWLTLSHVASPHSGPGVVIYMVTSVAQSKHPKITRERN